MTTKQRRQVVTQLLAAFPASERRACCCRSRARGPGALTERWSMDFVSDALADGRSFRCFTLVDDFTRECPAIEVATSIPAWRVIHVLERVAA